MQQRRNYALGYLPNEIVIIGKSFVGILSELGRHDMSRQILSNPF